MALQGFYGRNESRLFSSLLRFSGFVWFRARHYIDLLGEYGGCMKCADPAALEPGQWRW